MIPRQSAAGHDAVYVGDGSAGFVPTYAEYWRKPDLSPEVAGIGRYFQQRSGAGFEQKTEEKLLVLPHQRHQRMGNTKHEVEIAHREQFLAPGHAATSRVHSSGTLDSDGCGREL